MLLLSYRMPAPTRKNTKYKKHAKRPLSCSNLYNRDLIIIIIITDKLLINTIRSVGEIYNIFVSLSIVIAAVLWGNMGSHICVSNLHRGFCVRPFFNDIMWRYQFRTIKKTNRPVLLKHFSGLTSFLNLNYYSKIVLFFHRRFLFFLTEHALLLSDFFSSKTHRKIANSPRHQYVPTRSFPRFTRFLSSPCAVLLLLLLLLPPSSTTTNYLIPIVRHRLPSVSGRTKNVSSSIRQHGRF